MKIHRNLGNDLDLGILPGRNARLFFPRTLRDKHLYVCGGTGSGKSKFLEGLIRQDIINWRKSKSAVIVLDPHGSLFIKALRNSASPHSFSVASISLS